MPEYGQCPWHSKMPLKCGEEQIVNDFGMKIHILSSERTFHNYADQLSSFQR